MLLLVSILSHPVPALIAAEEEQFPHFFGWVKHAQTSCSGSGSTHAGRSTAAPKREWHAQLLRQQQQHSSRAASPAARSLRRPSSPNRRPSSAAQGAGNVTANPSLLIRPCSAGTVMPGQQQQQQAAYAPAAPSWQEQQQQQQAAKGKCSSSAAAQHRPWSPAAAAAAAGMLRPGSACQPAGAAITSSQQPQQQGLHRQRPNSTSAQGLGVNIAPRWLQGWAPAPPAISEQRQPVEGAANTGACSTDSCSCNGINPVVGQHNPAAQRPASPLGRALTGMSGRPSSALSSRLSSPTAVTASGPRPSSPWAAFSGADAPVAWQQLGCSGCNDSRQQHPLLDTVQQVCCQQRAALQAFRQLPLGGAAAASPMAREGLQLVGAGLLLELNRAGAPLQLQLPAWLMEAAAAHKAAAAAASGVDGQQLQGSDALDGWGAEQQVNRVH